MTVVLYTLQIKKGEFSMRTIKISLLGIAVCLSFLFTGSLAVNANQPADPGVQIVPKTKHYSRATYHKGRWVTVTSYRHGKRYTKKVWRTGNRWGHKVANKSHDIVMGKKKRTP
jgi:hypothetical protein